MSKSETQTSKGNGEDGCCLLALLRVQENSRLITVPHYLTSLSELFQWQACQVRPQWSGHLLLSGTSQNATLQKCREGHSIPLVTIIRQAVHKCAPLWLKQTMAVVKKQLLL